MEALFLLIPLSVILVFLIGLAFWWSVHNGQYDDLEGPGYRILMDDDKSQDEGQTEAGDKVQDKASADTPTDAKGVGNVGPKKSAGTSADEDREIMP